MIPPKKFYKMSKEEQILYANKKMNEAYNEGDQWKKLAQQARGNRIPEPNERPDEITLKGE